MTKTSPMKFMQQVRNEVMKISWPGRREVALTTVMVFIMVTIVAIFFTLVDISIRSALVALLGVL